MRSGVSHYSWMRSGGESLYLDDELLLVQRDGLERLLDDPAAVHLEGQRLHVGPQLQQSQSINHTTETIWNAIRKTETVDIWT